MLFTKKAASERRLSDASYEKCRLREAAFECFLRKMPPKNKFQGGIQGRSRRSTFAQNGREL